MTTKPTAMKCRRCGLRFLPDVDWLTYCDNCARRLFERTTGPVVVAKVTAATGDQQMNAQVTGTPRDAATLLRATADVIEKTWAADG